MATRAAAQLAPAVPVRRRQGDGNVTAVTAVIAARIPGARDIFLLVEVMDTSVEYDRRRKAPLYARAGVRELWLVDIPAGVLDVQRAFPDVTLAVDDILG